MLRIAVASGKGGTGKTFVATNLYAVMKQEGYVVSIVDGDAEVPNDALFLHGQMVRQTPVHVFCPSVDLDKCVYCGICAEACHFHAITCIPSIPYLKVMEDLCHACTACREVCPQAAVIAGQKEIGKVTTYGLASDSFLYESRLKEGEHSPVPVIREAILAAQKQSSDFLILDAPPGCACPFVNTVKEADVVLLVTEPTPFGLSDLKHTVQVLRQLGKPFFVVLNRADLGDGQMKTYLAAEHIEILSEIPYSSSIAKAYAQGRLATLEDDELYQLFACLINNVLQYEGSCHKW